MPPNLDQTVLVVEDDPECLEAIAEVLQHEGYGTLLARNGSEALESLQYRRRPDLILLDLMMPVMDGWEFLKALRRLPRFAGIPVVLLSAESHLAKRAEALGVAGHIGKPVELETLLSAVSRHAAARLPA